MKNIARLLVCAAVSMSIAAAFAQTSGTGGTGSISSPSTTTVPGTTGIQPGTTMPGIIPPNNTNQSAIGTTLNNETRPTVTVPPNTSLSPLGAEQPSTNQTPVQPGSGLPNQPSGTLQPNAPTDPLGSLLSPTPGQVIPPNPVEGSLQPQP